MVAELSSIPLGNAHRRTATVGPERLRSSAKPKSRPRWIEAATREPIYSVLDDNETLANLASGSKRNIVVISAVKSEKQAEDPGKLIEGKGAGVDRVISEDEDPLYSVVRKPRRVQLAEAGSEKSKLEKIGEQTPKDSQAVRSRQEELKRWLQVASNQPPEPGRLFDLGEMYSSHLGELDQVQADWKRNVSVPRGVVGLVGPYRVKSLNEKYEMSVKG